MFRRRGAESIVPGLSGERMRIIRPWACLLMACLEETAPSLDQVSPTDQPSAIQRDFHFEERPSQDFFCPVSLELLLEPQQTSCCDHHLSSEAVNRLLREGKPCPMCGGEQWSAMLDKYHRRRVHEVRVRCSHRCGWVGEMNAFFRHVRKASVGVRVLRTEMYVRGGRGEALAHVSQVSKALS